jgi:hypothetical protein
MLMAISPPSRLAAADEDHILARLGAPPSDVVEPTIAAHNECVVACAGHGSLVELRAKP